MGRAYFHVRRSACQTSGQSGLLGSLNRRARHIALQWARVCAMAFLWMVPNAVIVLAKENAGDPVRGEIVFQQCSTCHMLGTNARHRTGPSLNNIVSAPAGRAEGYRYSRAFQKAAEKGLIWDPKTLSAFLASPRKKLPGTKMTFAGLTRETDRRDVIAYLANFTQGAEPMGTSVGFAVSDEILAIEGDIEYGAYLASECTACHRSDGQSNGIPNIVGWEIERFVTTMHAFKYGHRQNTTMQTISSRLGDDEIAALAKYFNMLE